MSDNCQCEVCEDLIEVDGKWHCQKYKISFTPSNGAPPPQCVSNNEEECTIC